MTRAEKRERGLYLNANRWWMRVRGQQRSTGTATLKVANRIARMVRTLEAEHKAVDLLDAVRDRKLLLIDLYDAFIMGQFDEQRAELTRKAKPDTDLAPLVDQWAENLTRKSITPRTGRDYVRLARALFPEGEPFPASQLTEDYVERMLLAIPNVTDSTRRRYAAAWRLCVPFLGRRVPELADPFSFAGEWLPRNGASRTTWWTHAQTLTVLDRMSGEPRRAMALIFGTGMELGALRNLQHSHILADRTIVAPGSKNAYRRGRTVICDAWAWAIFNEGRAPGFPTMPLFTATDNEIRNAFYTAQVDAQFIAPPERSAATRKRLWGDVAGLHHIHDARHTFAVVRLLGLDGEPKRTMKFVAANLGHADETMTMRIYSKAGVAQRHDLALEEIAADVRFQNAAQ